MKEKDLIEWDKLQKDEDGGCNAGITIEQWHEMHINGIECEKYDYIYETDDEN